MEETKKGFFEMLDKKYAFLFGMGAGFLVLCTLGFFILLFYVMGGNAGTAKIGDNADDSNNAVVQTGSVVGPKQFSECLDNGKMASEVKKEQQLGESLGVRGTPATFVNGYLVSGALPYDMLKQVVDAVLAGKVPDFDFMKSETTGKVEKTNLPDLGDVDWRGNKDAKVTIVEFSDFECPYCQRFVPSIDQLLEEYGTKVRFVYMSFPLSFHPNAQKASEAYQCAKAQGKGWEMHDKLYELGEASQLSIDSYKKTANELGLK